MPHVCCSSLICNVLLISLSLFLSGCKTPPPPDEGPTRLYVVTTTSIIADTVQEIGGDLVRVEALMGPGIDPHTYKASEGDVERLGKADIIFYNGLHLEARMTTVFERMNQSGRKVVAVTEDIPEYRLLQADDYDGQFDPHVWMDTGLWTVVANTIADTLIEEAPDHADTVRTNLEYFQGSLRMLFANMNIALDTVPDDRRVLITAHDAFGYFGRQFGFEVRGLQGISTASEAGAQDVQELANFISERRIPAIFVESSVPRRSLEALQEAVQSKGYNVSIGRPLYSDSVGPYGTAQATYIGMMRYNAGVISEALTPESEE